MSKRAAKLTLVSTGIVSGLLLILYLPVLIWSPPWGEDGYYCHLQSFHEEPLYFYTCNRTHYIGHKSYKHDHDLFIHHWNYRPKTNDWYSRLYKGSHRIEKGKLIFEDDSGHLTSDFVKTSNPLIIWHIKWLEWTN